jgi:hypothetical protein
MIGGKQMDGQILRERKGNELFGPGEGEEIVKADDEADRPGRLQTGPG